VAVVTVLVLALTGVLFPDDDKDPEASPTGPATSASTPAAPLAPPALPSRPAATSPPAERTVDTPARAGGLDRLTDGEYPQITQIRQKAATGSKVAAYGRSEGSGAPTPIAVVMLMTNPGDQAPATVLEQMMIGMREKATETSAPDLGLDRESDAGPLGGLMRCVSMTSADKVLPTCVWADRDTVGVVYALDETTLEGAATLTRRLRPDLER